MMKRFLILVLRKTQEVLKVRVLSYLLNGLTVRGAQAFLNNQGAQSNTSRFSGIARPAICKDGRILLFNLLPGDLFRKNDPAIRTSELATEGQVKVLKYQLIGIVFAIHP